MGLINAGVALSQVRGFRMCWIPGRFSGGKSAIAFRLSYELSMAYDYLIASNQECVWNEDAPPDWKVDADGNITLQTIAVVDEGGLYLQDENYAMEFLAFAGKMDLIVLLPSITEPCDVFSSLTIQPVYNYRAIGVPYNVYQWNVQQRKSKFEGRFAWLGMEEIYGTYSTLNPSTDARGMVYYLKQKVKEYRAWYMDRQKIPSWQEEYTVMALAEEATKRGKKGKADNSPATVRHLELDEGQSMDAQDQTKLLVNAISQASKKAERASDTIEAVDKRAAARDRNRRSWFS